MRLIAGIARGMVLTVPAGKETRPTADRVREAVFSSLGERVADAEVLDLFAGTGAFGFEAASRGATAVTFIENARPAIDAIRANQTSFGRNRGAAHIFDIVRGDVFEELERLGPDQRFNLIFADPPYGDIGQQLLADTRLSRLLAADGMLILESGKRDLVEAPAAWNLMRRATYGDTTVMFLKK